MNGSYQFTVRGDFVDNPKPVFQYLHDWPISVDSSNTLNPSALNLWTSSPA